LTRTPAFQKKVAGQDYNIDISNGGGVELLAFRGKLVAIWK
jgi:hypothetical protein